MAKIIANSKQVWLNDVMNILIRIGLLLSIAVVYPFMVGFGIEAFYPPPKQGYEVCRTFDPNNITKPNETKVVLAIDPQNDPEYKKCYDEKKKKVDIHSRNL